MDHWPATKKWSDINYLLKVAGERTVPVEIGSHYADNNWSQKLMPLRNFIENYFLKDSENIGYLAQHNLFDQVKFQYNSKFSTHFIIIFFTHAV